MSDLYSAVTIRPAKTDADIQKAIHVRWVGYKKYEGFEEPHLESLDLGANCTIFLAEDADGATVGTMRILNRTSGPIELERFISVDELMPYSPRSVAELTRFSILPSPKSRLIKHLFWKTYLHYCLENSIDFMLVSGKESVIKDYRLLYFTELENGHYTHPSLGNLPHYSYYLELPKARSLYLEQKHPMYHFLWELQLDNLKLN